MSLLSVIFVAVVVLSIIFREKLFFNKTYQNDVLEQDKPSNNDDPLEPIRIFYGVIIVIIVIFIGLVIFLSGF